MSLVRWPVLAFWFPSAHSLSACLSAYLTHDEGPLVRLDVCVCLEWMDGYEQAERGGCGVVGKLGNVCRYMCVCVCVLSGCKG